ncbi:MAG: BamA/TamA family outer membrane protein [Bacteroidota bacterium]
MKRFYTCLMLFVLGATQFKIAVSQTLDHHVYLLGNLADLQEDDLFLDEFIKVLPESEPFTVLLTGDLISTVDVPAEKDLIQLTTLLSAISKFSNGKAVIIPGDRDWSNSGERGLESIRKVENYVDQMKLENVIWSISGGCPGPKSFQLSGNLVLVAIDTQWWNHPFLKPQAANADCKVVTKTDFLNELTEELDDADGKNLLVAGHHPLISVGESGGKRSAKQHLLPPVYGSFRVAYHQHIGSTFDIVNQRFDPVRHKIESMVSDKSSAIYASGHDYDLQVLRQESSFFINSGSVAEARFVGKDKTIVEFAESVQGFIELVYYEDGRVDYVVHQILNNTGLKPLQQKTLLSSPCGRIPEGLLANTAFVPCKITEEREVTTLKESTVTSGGYYPAKGMKKFLFGTHYRSSWNQSIEVPYLDLRTEKTGLTIYEKGGGRQTTSLKMKGGDGKEYAFRSVDKDPTKVLGKEFRGTVVSEAFKDVTSMQHPYGALVAASMLDETDILHVNPKLYVLPDDASLGPFQKQYAGLLGMLEEKPINVKKVKVPFANAEEVVQTYKMFRALYKDHDHVINKQQYAEARMFDILVGDWGRHEDNWKWAGYSNNNSGFTYRPIPRDRDHIFSRWDGFLIWLADREWAKPSGENFGYKIKDIKSLTWQSRHFDRFLLSELSLKEWEAAAEYIQTKITDEVIERSLRQMPKEVYPLSAPEISEKLKQRAKDLTLYAREYYQLLSKEVDVVGSNKKEQFDVIRQSNGDVKVVMRKIRKDGSLGRILYERVFVSHETKEIRLFGLDGADVFNVSGESNSSIPVRIIGGPDPDKIVDISVVKKGGRKTRIYEKDLGSEMDLGRESKNIDHWDNSLYNYDRTRFAYHTYAPIFSIGSNSTAGFGGSLGVRFKRQKFGKSDFSAIHTIKGRFTTEDIVIFNYEGRYRHVFGKWDVELGVLYADDNLFNKYFGPGNGSINDDDLDDDGFYETRYETISGGVGVIHDFWKKSFFRLGASFEKNDPVLADGTILDVASAMESVPLETTSLDILETGAELDLDFRDRSDLPEHGTRLYVGYQHGFLTNEDYDGYGVVKGFIEKYSTWRKKHPWTLALRMGGSTSYGEDLIPFYKRDYLGQENNLRGYEQHRFTGKSNLFLNSELRMQLTSFQTALVPIKFGIEGFFDVGRVFSDIDTSEQWHEGYGFGVYFVPIKESFSLNISVGFSEEESGLLLIGFGGAIN